MFLVKYISLALYDENIKKIFFINHEEIQSINNYGWYLIGIPKEPDGSMTNHYVDYIKTQLSNSGWLLLIHPLIYPIKN